MKIEYKVYSKLEELARYFPAVSLVKIQMIGNKPEQVSAPEAVKF